MKRLQISLCAILLLLALAACGGDSGSTTNATGGGTNGSTNTTGGGSADSGTKAPQEVRELTKRAGRDVFLYLLFS